MSLTKDMEPSVILCRLMAKSGKLPLDPQVDTLQPFYNRQVHHEQIVQQRGKKTPRFTGRLRS